MLTTMQQNHIKAKCANNKLFVQSMVFRLVLLIHVLFISTTSPQVITEEPQVFGKFLNFFIGNIFSFYILCIYMWFNMFCMQWLNLEN